MVQLLCKRALCVNALARQLGVTAAAASQHLRVLRDAGMVSSEKRGYYVHYYVERNTAGKLRAAVGCLIKPGPAGKRKRGSR
jgi:DNA-binding transcriptional ArsR family regulator